MHSDHNLFDKNDGNYEGLNNPDLSVSGLDNDIVAGPKFKNSSSGDFRLSNASQAVDAGLFSYDDSYDEIEASGVFKDIESSIVRSSILKDSKRIEQESKIHNGDIKTEITPAQKFWRAEEYHQQYIEKNRGRFGRLFG